MKIYPKTLYIKQTNNTLKFLHNQGVMHHKSAEKIFTHIVKNKKEEIEYRAQAASMEPNFTNVVQEVAFIK